MFEFFITRPLGFIIKLIYDLVSNYGVAIILFTIVVKLILMPLAIKSQKAMKKQQKIQPYVAELQKKYENDKEKLNQEMMKLYKENNISMMGGCLPMLIQMPILFGLYRVIQKPLTYLLGVDFSLAESLTRAEEIISQMGTNFADIMGNLKNMSVEQIINNSQIQLSTWCNILNGPEDPWVINFGFLGLDLSVIPSVSINYILSGRFTEWNRVLLILIPIIAVLTTWFSMVQSQKMTQGATSASDSPATGMNKSMNIMMPLMTGFFAFTLPSGLGLYWIISNMMQVVQQYVLDFYFKKKGDDFDVKIPTRNRKNSKKR